MPNVFSDFDFKNFWDNSDYALETYVSEPLTDEMLVYAENELGYKLPSSYVELMRLQNGGHPINDCFPTQTPTLWADNYVKMDSISGISTKEICGLCGEYGSLYMIEDIEYPDIGVYFAGCPSGHAMFAFDYRKCGKDGEPSVVYVAQEDDFEITFLAKDFETFIKGLKNESEFEE